jgi:hypothetical protein
MWIDIICTEVTQVRRWTYRLGKNIIHLTVVIHSSDNMPYSQIHISLSVCPWVRSSSLSGNFTHSFICAPNQPAFQTIQLNHIFKHSLDHLVLDSRQPAVSHSAILALFMLSAKHAFIHQRSFSCFWLSNQWSIPSFSQPLTLSRTHIHVQPLNHLKYQSQFFTQKGMCSVSHCFTLPPTEPGVLAIFHSFVT